MMPRASAVSYRRLTRCAEQPMPAASVSKEGGVFQFSPVSQFAYVTTCRKKAFICTLRFENSAPDGADLLHRYVHARCQSDAMYVRGAKSVVALMARTIHTHTGNL